MSIFHWTARIFSWTSAYQYLLHKNPLLWLHQVIQLPSAPSSRNAQTKPLPCEERPPPVWPPHLIIVQRRIPDLNGSKVAPATAVTYYDFEAGGNLIQITPDNSSKPVVWDLELDSHHSYYFEPETASCNHVELSVGVLRRDFLTDAQPLGESIYPRDGRKECGWTKLDFLDYYVDFETNEPTRWYFHTMKATFETIYYDTSTRPDPSLFVPPDYCFSW